MPTEQADLAAIEHASCLECLTTLARHASDGESERRRGLRSIVTGAPVPLFNALVAEGPPVEQDDVETAFAELAARTGAPSIWVRVGVDETMSAAAGHLGLRVVDRAPGMVVSADAIVPVDVDGLRCETVRGAAALEAHLDLMARSFGMPRAAIEPFVTQALVDAPEVIAAIGRVDGDAVCTALGIRTGDDVCLMNVATPPEHRGRGYGAAITEFVVRTARADGARFATLQSTEDGFGVYRRLGFETVVDYEVWSR